MFDYEVRGAFVLAFSYRVAGGRNGPLWEVRGIEISTPDRRGTIISISFLGLSPLLGGSKKVSIRKII